MILFHVCVWVKVCVSGMWVHVCCVKFWELALVSSYRQSCQNLSELLSANKSKLKERNSIFVPSLIYLHTSEQHN